MIKNIKVLYDGEEMKLERNNSIGSLAIGERYNLDGTLQAYTLIKVYPMYCDSELVGVVYPYENKINNSWVNDKEIKVIIEQQNIISKKQGVILNYTPHTVNIIDPEGNKIQDFPSVGEARCKQATTQTGNIAGVPITSTIFGEVEGLPKAQEGTYYIVSRLIRQALPYRNDLLVPNEVVRDKEGKILGCKSLAEN